MVTEMSQESRGPLNGVIGMPDLGLDIELTTDQRECLDLEALDFKLRDCMQEAVKAFAVAASQKGLKLLSNAGRFTALGELDLRFVVESAKGEVRIVRFAVGEGERGGDLAAAMDGNSSKPLSAAASDRQQAHASTVSFGWDRALTLERLGGDEKLLLEIIEIFVREVPNHLAGLRAAIARQDAETVERIAHSLQGELGYLSIDELSQAARALEAKGRTSDFAGALSLLPRFEVDMSRLLSVIREVQAASDQDLPGVTAPGGGP